jgi:RluA family pseudouridine synthase
VLRRGQRAASRGLIGPVDAFSPLDGDVLDGDYDVIVVPEAHVGLELDEFLGLHYPHLAKGYLRQQVRERRVLVDGNATVPSQRVHRDQVVMVRFDDEATQRAAPVAPSTRVPVLYEDADVLVVDKPARLAVEPERWRRAAATVAGALLDLVLERSSAGDADDEEMDEGLDDDAPAPVGFRPRLVHRLDKDTSGVLVVAKHLDAERRLRRAFEVGRVAKTYLALVEGEHPLGDGEEETIDLPIGPDGRRSGRQRIDEREVKSSVTVIRVVERYRGYTLLAASPRTGRTHQIRVHLAAKGFPLVVDPLYGRRDALLLSDFKRGYRQKRGRAERPLLERLSLHAAAIAIPTARDDGAGEPPDWAIDGADGELLEGRFLRVRAPLPEDLERTTKQLAKWRPIQR